jgi:hypothetical protein
MKLPVRLVLACLLALPASAQQITASRSPITVVTTTGAASITPVNATETNITSIRVPGGSLGLNGWVDLKCLWGYVNSANTKALIIRWNSTAAATSGGGVFAANVSATTSVGVQTEHVLSNNNSTSAQILSPNSGIAPFAVNASALVAAALDTTQDSFINLNATLQLGSEGVSIQHCGATITGSSP